jgi:hypothetical protein
MRGCRIEISLECLLKQLGLDNCKDITLYNVRPHQTYNCIELFVISDTRTDLPDLHSGEEFPRAVIECERIQSKIKILE